MRKATTHQSDRLIGERRAREWRALDTAVTFCGSQTALGKVFDVTYQAVQHWYAKGVPLEHCPVIEALTRGAVQCEHLREDFVGLNERPYRLIQRFSPDNGTQRAYVSGPMTGYTNMNFAAFHAETTRLRAAGLEVYNPAELNMGANATWEECQRANVSQIVRCNTISLLPGWHRSLDSRIEYKLAKRFGFRIILPREAA